MTDLQIQMVDLRSQYATIAGEIKKALEEVMKNSAFIGGPAVEKFKEELQEYLGVRHVIPCGNGTDALQIALMTLGLEAGDEVIVPSFTFVASVEVVALMGLTPVLADVDPGTFNINTTQLPDLLSSRTRAIMPVHLFGQCCEMAPILQFADEHDLVVIEDNAQSIGARYNEGGAENMSGTMGRMGCLSFYPSKNLGCYGDGGAICTNYDQTAGLARSITNHGMSRRYYHDRLGLNSRLDAFQAAVLSVKLKKLDDYIKARQKAAAYYDAHLEDVNGLKIPLQAEFSTHVYHQYTIQVMDGERDGLKEYLQNNGIPTMIYYPVPTQDQKAFRAQVRTPVPLDATNTLCQRVLSLPMHTELSEAQLDHICKTIRDYFS